MSEPFTQQDFRIEGDKLRLSRRGFHAVLIMSKDAASMQLIKMLASINVNRLETGYLDISQGKNREVIIMSRKTSTEIKNLPYLGFFCDGKLKCRYKGEVTKNAIAKYFEDKIISESMQSASSERKTTTKQSAQFSMAKNGIDSGRSGKGAKVLPDQRNNGMIGLNAAWRGDKDILNE